MQRTIWTILLCGNDPMLLNTREMLLIHAGFIVSSCSETDIAMMLQTPQIDLTVIGHTMTAEQAAWTAKVVRSKWPDTKILFLIRADSRLSTISENEYESGSRNPSHLIQACRQILEQ
jgi:DNA-binding response OmpR family regulator